VKEGSKLTKVMMTELDMVVMVIVIKFVSA